MKVRIRNNQEVIFRPLEKGDAILLFHYFQNLSAETRSRFGPHPFDWDTVKLLCTDNSSNLKKFVAISSDQQLIISYILFQIEMVDADLDRYKRRGQMIKNETAASFAPSVADEWQSSGLGWAFTRYVETKAFDLGIKQFVLWGGVQSTNERARKFYDKLGYKPMGVFHFNNMDNVDMIKSLP